MSYQQESDCVIFDRCPVDCIAYCQYTANHGTTDIDDQFVESLAERVRNSLQKLDLLIFLPITSQWPVVMENDGIRPIDLPCRDEVDAIFKQIDRDQRFSVMPINNPPVLIELWSAREDRLNSLEQAIDDLAQTINLDSHRIWPMFCPNTWPICSALAQSAAEVREDRPTYGQTYLQTDGRDQLNQALSGWKAQHKEDVAY